MELKLAINLAKVFIDKKFFGVSEIVFVHKQNNVNSFLRKTIIVNQNLDLTCNILGKTISREV